MRGIRPRRPTGASNLAVSLDSQNWSPVDGSDFVVFLDLFPKLGKTTRTVSWFPRESHSYTPCVEYAREDRPTGESNFAVSLDSQNWSPVDGSDFVVFSICATITLLRSPNASSPHLVSGSSLLLPPFTQRSARNYVEKNVNRHLRFPNWSPVDWSDFVVFLDLFPKLGKTTRTVS